jgi:succinate dehydrogenase/fumarate reductase flavoprotein subunit
LWKHASSSDKAPELSSKEVRFEIHSVLKQANYDLQKHQFNTVASAAMKILNALERLPAGPSPTAEEGVSILRDGESLQQAAAAIAELKERLGRLQLTDHSRVFNTELTAALELEFMVDVTEAVVHSALARTESRGAHYRRDFPQRNDGRFLKHSLACRTEREPRIDYLDVTITRWQPEKRTYGD